MTTEQIELNLYKLKVPVNKGFSVINLNSFTELLQYDESMKSYGMDYRGQADSRWPLLPGLFRKYPNIKNDEINEMIESYRQMRSLNNLSNDEILAYGQHHGLLTQLLDVSQNLKVALFFAYKDEIKEDNHESVSVWAFNVVHNLKWSESLKEKRPSLPDIIKPLEYNDKVSDRQKNQKGLFLKFPVGCKDFKAWFEDYDDGYNIAKIIQFKMPKEERTKCLNELSKYGITPEFIFPDIEGKTLMINMSKEIESYRILLNK